MRDFTVINRNPGHWDIYDRGGSRLFRIRGEAGRCYLFDEQDRTTLVSPVEFNTVAGCMAFVCDQLMYEPANNEN